MSKLKISKPINEILSTMAQLSQSIVLNNTNLIVSPMKWGMIEYTFPKEHDLIDIDQSFGVKDITNFLNIVGSKEVKVKHKDNVMTIKDGSLSVKYATVDSADIQVAINQDIKQQILNADSVLSFDITSDDITSLKNVSKILKTDSLEIKLQDSNLVISSFNSELKDENSTSIELQNVTILDKDHISDPDWNQELASFESKTFLDMLMGMDFQIEMKKLENDGDVEIYLVAKAKLNKEQNGELVYIIVGN